jgi:hypothetical protein
MTQVVECFPNKHETLSLIPPVTTKKKKIDDVYTEYCGQDYKTAGPRLALISPKM